MHTIKQIIDNQSRYRKLMLSWMGKDLNKSKSNLHSINSDDEFIQEQVKKLKSRFKKTLYKKEVDKLFFMHPNRSEQFYVWWDNKEREVVILNYGKK